MSLWKAFEKALEEDPDAVLLLFPPRPDLRGELRKWLPKLKGALDLLHDVVLSSSPASESPKLIDVLHDAVFVLMPRMIVEGRGDACYMTFSACVELKLSGGKGISLILVPIFPNSHLEDHEVAFILLHELLHLIGYDGRRTDRKAYELMRMSGHELDLKAMNRRVDEMLDNFSKYVPPGGIIPASFIKEFVATFIENYVAIECILLRRKKIIE